MANIVVCEGTLYVPETVGSNPICDSGWVVQPAPVANIDDLFAQLQMLNSFDPEQAAKTIGYCFLIFTLGFIVGVIVRQLRRF